VTDDEALPEPVRVTGAPERIWLVLGLDDETGEVPFSELADVSWCSENQFPHDVEYVRVDLVQSWVRTKR